VSERPGVNEKVAIWLTARIGTMWVAYLFVLIAAVSLPAALASGSLIVIVAWTAQTFIQLVLLPVIMVGQDVQGRRTEATILDTHDMATVERAQNRLLIEDVTELLVDMRTILVAVHGSVTSSESAEKP